MIIKSGKYLEPVLEGQTLQKSLHRYIISGILLSTQNQDLLMGKHYPSPYNHQTPIVTKLLGQSEYKHPFSEVTPYKVITPYMRQGDGI